MTKVERQNLLDVLRGEVNQAVRVGLQRTVHDPHLKDGPGHTADEIKQIARSVLVRNHGQ